MHHMITLVDTSGGTLFTIGRPLRITASLPMLQEAEGGNPALEFRWRRPLRYDVIIRTFQRSQTSGPIN